MFSSVDAIPIILGTSNIFPRASNHEPIRAFANGLEVASFLSLRDDDRAARLKRNLHSTFTPNGVLAYEEHVDHTVNELISHLRAAGPTTDLKEWIQWFAFDTMARIAFSEDQGFMKQQIDIDGAAAAARTRFKHWTFYWAIPWLDAILYKNYFARRSRRSPSGLMRIAIRAIESRKRKGGLGTHHDLLDLYLKSAKADPALYTQGTVIGLTITTIQAGSETTAYTTAITMFTLLENPRVLQKLRAELESVSATTKTGWDLPSMADLRPLPYLEACVKEANRIRPVTNIMAERVVHAGGATIAGVHVPGGTIVANNTAGLYSDASIWGPDVDVFRPERWLEASEEQRVRMNRANLLFNAGKRMCLGLNVSWLEMRKVIAGLVMNFEVRIMEMKMMVFEMERG
jgi:cytochrome P450